MKRNSKDAGCIRHTHSHPGNKIRHWHRPRPVFANQANGSLPSSDGKPDSMTPAGHLPCAAPPSDTVIQDGTGDDRRSTYRKGREKPHNTFCNQHPRKEQHPFIRDWKSDNSRKHHHKQQDNPIFLDQRTDELKQPWHPRLVFPLAPLPAPTFRPH